jgi:hypothetical protein
MQQKKILNIFFALFVFMLLYNYPIIEIADRSGFVFGIPVLYFLVFSIWFINILVLYFIAKNYLNNNSK